MGVRGNGHYGARIDCGHGHQAEFLDHREKTALDDDGYPVRDDNSTTCKGAIENAEQFGRRICAEALRRGLLYALLALHPRGREQKDVVRRNLG